VPMTSPELPVTPKVLRWAREVSGFSVDEVAERLETVSKRITPETLLSWEEGEALPRLTALRKLSQLYRRPLAVFFLSEPPPEAAPPRSFRLLPSGEPRPLSPETLLAVRTARRLHQLGQEAAEELGYELAKELPRAELSSDPVLRAARERQRLGATFEAQSSFRDAYKALWYWRDLVEGAGCFVFQLSFPLEDARAFSEHFDAGPVIVLSSKDEPVGRVFSLLHEYAHLLLRMSGVCPEFTMDYARSFEGRVEQFCNAFAASFLVPASELEAAAAEHGAPPSEGGLVALSYRFSVSKHVILRRFLDLGRVDRRFYSRKVEQWEEERKARKKPPGGPVKQEVKSVSQRGRRLAALIVEPADRGLISPPAVYEGLGVRTRYLADVRAQLAV